jgi:SAM-dependent methyltransferase
MTARALRGLRRLLNAARKVRAGLRLRGESISPEVLNDLYQAHRSIYLFAGRFVEGERVLDLGCGSGYGTRLLKEHGAREVVGLDLEPRSIRYARRRFGREGIEFRVGDAESPPHDLGRLDFVVASNVLEHLRWPERAVEQIGGLLSPHGRLLVAVPPIVDDQGLAVHEAIPYHRSNLLIDQWQELLACCFRNLEAVRHLPPEGVHLDFADPFPSRVDAADFRFLPCSPADLSGSETLTAVFLCGGVRSGSL